MLEREKDLLLQKTNSQKPEAEHEDFFHALNSEKAEFTKQFNQKSGTQHLDHTPDTLIRHDTKKKRQSRKSK